jgi:hypothetical protein
MARTPLMQEVQRAAAQAGDPTRRELLKRAGAAGAAVSLGSMARWLPEANAATAPRVAVVGAGLAGLTCAYRLKQAGYSARVYEASDRVGGRCWTIRGAFADGQIAEHGGELIDQGHTEVRHVANELGLTLDNLLAAEPNGSDDAFFFDGQRYPVTQATSDLKDIWQQIHSDVSAAGYPTLYNSSTARGRELDALSIAQYIDRYVPCPMAGISSAAGATPARPRPTTRRRSARRGHTLHGPERASIALLPETTHRRGRLDPRRALPRRTRPGPRLPRRSPGCGTSATGVDRGPNLQRRRRHLRCGGSSSRLRAPRRAR